MPTNKIENIDPSKGQGRNEQEVLVTKEEELLKINLLLDDGGQVLLQIEAVKPFFKQDSYLVITVISRRE